MYLLDTNVLSELRHGKPAQSPAVRAWAAAVPSDRLFLSAITVLEIENGILQLERRTPPQGTALRVWFEAVLAAFTGRILAFNETTARICAGLHVPDRKPERDAMIAATALEHGFTLVSRNVADFAAIRLDLINPWSPSAIGSS